MNSLLCMLLMLRSGLLRGERPHRLGTPNQRTVPKRSGSKIILHNTQTTDRFVLRFTLYREHRTINLNNVTLMLYKSIPQCTFQVQSQKHKYEVPNTTQSPLNQARLHIIPAILGPIQCVSITWNVISNVWLRSLIHKAYDVQYAWTNG